jgi:hypothetical protein
LPNIGLLQNTQSNNFIFIFIVYKGLISSVAKRTDVNGCKWFHKWLQMVPSLTDREVERRVSVGASLRLNLARLSTE